MDLVRKKKKILLIGGAKRSVNTLANLVKRTDVEFRHAIFMRGHYDEHKYADQLCAIAASHGLSYLVADRISREIEAVVNGMNCDAIVGIGVWRSLLSEEFLNSAKYGFLGLHGTPLPKYRGFAGIYWQIINGDDAIVLKGIRLASGIDDGPIVCDSNGNPIEGSVDLKNESHLADLLDEYEVRHIQLINRIIDLVRDDEIIFREQDHGLATYACHRGPEDGEVNWNDSTRNIFNFIRGQSKPLHGAYTFFQGKKIILWRVKPREDFSNYEGRIYGKVVQRDTTTGSIVILTRDSGIEIVEAELIGHNTTEIQRPIAIFSTIRARCTSAVEAFMFNAGQ